MTLDRSEITDEHLEAIHDDCQITLAIISTLRNCILNSSFDRFEFWSKQLPHPRLTPRSLTSEFLGSRSAPMKYWVAKREFDAASPGSVLVTFHRGHSNCHEAVYFLYSHYLAGIWKVVLGGTVFEEVTAMIDAGHRDKAEAVMGVMDSSRFNTRYNAIQELEREIRFDFANARASLERELARAFHNRAMRPGRTLGITTADAEKLADKSKKTSAAMPDTHDVRDLCHLLGKKRGKGKALVEIAREFTGETRGNDPKARSLLRQARRYAHLWRRGDR